MHERVWLNRRSRVNQRWLAEQRARIAGPVDGLLIEALGALAEHSPCNLWLERPAEEADIFSDRAEQAQVRLVYYVPDKFLDAAPGKWAYSVPVWLTVSAPSAGGLEVSLGDGPWPVVGGEIWTPERVLLGLLGTHGALLARRVPGSEPSRALAFKLSRQKRQWSWRSRREEQVIAARPTLTEWAHQVATTFFRHYVWTWLTCRAVGRACKELVEYFK